MVDDRFFPNRSVFSLKEICDHMGIPIPIGSNHDKKFVTVGPLDKADDKTISFCNNKKYIDSLKTTKAGACVISEEMLKYVPQTCVALVSKAPYRDTGKISSLFYPNNKKQPFIDKTVVIHPSVLIGEQCYIGPYAVIGENVKIGNNTSIGPHVVIEKACILGERCTVEPHVTISHAIIGNDVFIKPGARIGQPGFGFHMDEKGHFDVPQLGIVLIGDNVHIGSNTTIDRGSMENTVIGNGVRIDNLVQIAHNVNIGDNSVIVAQVGIAGSTKLGKFVVAAGQVGIAGHLNIGNGVQIAAQSGLMRDVPDNSIVAGSPAVPIRDWHKQTILLQRLSKEKKI